jgi:DNA-binding transcriptional regulator YhcF (GntR family)
MGGAHGRSGGSMISIDTQSATPPYEQLRVQLIEQVQGGQLAAGTRIPTVRKLAEDLGLAPNTVARAYRELEADGFIETRGRNGSFVSAHGDAAQKQAQEAARAYADRIRKLGIPRDQAIDYVTGALEG